MNPVDKLKQLMSKLVELPSAPNKLDVAIDFCSEGEFSTAQDVSDAIIADIQSYNNPKLFLWEKCNIDLDNDDVGSIVGYDASGGPVLDKYDIVPENGTVADLVVPPESEVINGLTVTYPPYDDLNVAGKFIMKCMSKWWLKGAFDLVEQAYGLTFNENSFTTSMPIQLDDIPSSGGAITMAYVASNYNPIDGNTTSIYCAVNTNVEAYGNMDLTNPNGKANSFAGSNMFLDRVLCHELVHAVMSANISGFNTRLTHWFNEGTAELIAGADDTRKDGLLATAGSVDMFEAGLDENASDTLRWYTTGYIWLRWYIKHTAALMPDLSFDRSLPDIEIFEYKVSDGIAFEWGRANNCKFNLVSDELVNFVSKYHTDLSKWDLCTSEEYLHSGFGSTIRVPYDDARENVNIDYINLDPFRTTNVSSVIYLEPFLCSDPNIPNKFGLGKATSDIDDINFFSIESINNHYLLNDYYANLEGLTCLSISVSDFFSVGFLTGTVIVLLTGNCSVRTFVERLGYSDLSEGIEAISSFISSNGNLFRLIFADCRTFDLSMYDTVDQAIYENSGIVTADDRYVRRTVLAYDEFGYLDKRTNIHEIYNNLVDFKENAVSRYDSFDYTLSADSLQGSSAYFYNNFFVRTISDVFSILTESSIVYDSSRIVTWFDNQGASEFYTNMLNLNYAPSLPFIPVFPNFSGIGWYTPNLQAFRTAPNQAWHICAVDIYEFYKEALNEFEVNIYSLQMVPSKDHWVYIGGFEILCASGYTVEDVYFYIRLLKDEIEELGFSFAYCFMPAGVYSNMLYEFYLELKQFIVMKGDIDLGIDEFVCVPTKYDFKRYISEVNRWYDESRGYAGYREYFNIDGLGYKHIRDALNSNTDDTWIGEDFFFVRFHSVQDFTVPYVSTTHLSNTKYPCYYVSFTDLPFSDMIVPDKEIAIQAVDGVAGDVLSVNLHTIYDPLSPAYYQGGGVCKPVYDFVVDPETNKTITGLINHHNDGANVPNVDANYSYPVYGTGCPWIIYPDDIKELYDTVYFYFTRDNYTGTITYQFSSSHDDSVKSIYQTIVYGSTDTDNYTSKYPLYVGGGVVPFSPTQYSFTYQPPSPPGVKPPPPVTVTVMGNKYNFDLTTTLSSNTLPLYPIHPQDSKLSNFALKCADGEWKFISSFDNHNVESTTEDSPCLYTLSDTMRWGVMLPYVGSDFYNMYVYDKYFDNIRQLKPLRVLNPNMNLKEELGFGAITLPTLWASHTDNVHGLRTLTTTNYESKSILDIDFMQSVADGDVINIHGNYDAYGGDVNFNSSLGPYGVGPSSLVFTDPFDEFDRIEVIFTEDSGTNRYVASWTKAELYEAVFGSRDLDFDITRGSVHPLYWKVNKSGCDKKVFYGLEQNCGIIDIVGYKKKSFRYLVVPNGYSKREFNMFAYSDNKDNTLNYKQQFVRYNEIINSYQLNNDLYIYVGS